MRNNKIFWRTPPVALRPFIKQLFVVEATADHVDSHLPDTGAVMVLRFQGVCQLPDHRAAPQGAVTGLWETLRRHQHSQDYAAVIASFTAIGATAFLPQSLAEFTNTSCDLKNVLAHPAQIERLYEKVAQATDHAQRVQFVEKFLLTHLDASRVDSAMTAAVRMIKQTQGELRIAELARQCGLSQSALDRRFRRAVGVAPRRFASLVRLQTVMRLQEAGATLTTIAHAAGYYDQAHFIKDFKRITGAAPTAFFASSADH